MKRYELIEAVARNLGDLVAKDTVIAATGTTFDANTLIHPVSGQLKGYEAFFFGGAGAGQTRIITGFIPANNRAEIAETFTVIPSTNSEFLILQAIRKKDYDNAMDRAMGIAKEIYLEDYCPTMELVATQYEYAVPSGLARVHYLQLVPSGHTDYEADDEVNRVFMLRPPYWRVEDQRIIFDPRRVSLDTLNKELVLVIGQAKPSLDATDNAIVPSMLEEYLIHRTSQLLAMRKLGAGPEWTTLFASFGAFADRLESYIRSQPRGYEV